MTSREYYEISLIL